MRLILVLFLSLAWLESVLADSPEIDSTSPDQAWKITARWVKGGAAYHEGYDWDLRNMKSGKAYFHLDKIEDDEVLPRNVDVQWSPDGHYAALTFYYGRAMEGINIIRLSSEPESIDALPPDSTMPVEKTLIHREDLDLFTGYNRLLTSADHWINATDLSIEIDMLANLEDKKAAKKYILDTTWHKTVRFEGKSCKVLASICDSYDKRPEAN